LLRADESSGLGGATADGVGGVVTASASYQGTAKAPSVAWYVAAPIAIWPGRTTFRSRARLVVSVR